MQPIKSNKQYYDENNENGNLNSSTKDGKPNTVGKKILALGYVWIVILTALSNIFLFIKKRKEIDWKTLIPTVAISTIIAWFWGIFVLKYDPSYPSWLFLPWSITGIEWVQNLEDWLFYPVFGTFFCLLFFIIKEGENSKLWKKWIALGLNIALTLFFVSKTAVAGQSIAWYFALPSILMFLIVMLMNIKWNITHYIKLGLIIIILASVWDWLAVSWIHYIPGFAWAQQWTYISFDVNNVAHHSNVFLSYEKFKWAWIFDNPIEITPWFGIAGWNYIYSILLIFRFINRRNVEEIK